MRVMVMVKATKDTEAGILPTPELLQQMDQFNKELISAGIMLDADGLKASSHGARVSFNGSQRNVIDGPFTETRELIAGYWLWQVKSLQEAIELVKRCPHPHPGNDCEIEIRPLFEATDFVAQ